MTEMCHLKNVVTFIQTDQYPIVVNKANILIGM